MADLLHPFTQEPLTPGDAYAVALAAQRGDTPDDRLMVYLLRRQAPEPHRSAIDRAADDRLIELARGAVSGRE